MVISARMTLIDVPLWQIGVAVMVNILTIYFCIRFATKIYSTTILLSDNKPGWKDIMRILKVS